MRQLKVLSTLLLSALLHLHASASTNQLTTIEDMSNAALRSETFPFPLVVQATTGHRVLALDTNNPSHMDLCRKLKHAAALTASQAQAQPIQAARPNEAGNRIEAYVKEALVEAGLTPRTPRNSEGRAHATGYPDIEIPGEPHCYLELKTYSATAANNSQRTFYYSPSKTPKVTQDALHLLLAFRLDKEVRDNQTFFTPSHWQLISLEGLQVKMKLEFNQSNRGLYGEQTETLQIGEGQPENP